MSITTHYDAEQQMYEIRLGGTLRHMEFAARQSELASHIQAGHRPRVCVLLQDFQGWETGEDWDNLDFMFSHGDEIPKIAIVGDKKWEDEFRLFTGAGFRKTEVRFFETGHEEPARAWLVG